MPSLPLDMDRFQSVRLGLGIAWCWLLGWWMVPAAAIDPVAADPPLDHRHPPSLVEITFKSQGALLNGLIYQAQGERLRPAVVFLHGYPGNERNLDVAQAVRRAGFHAVYFNYRGSWGSGGVFSWQNAVDDAHQVIRYLRSEEARTSHRIDPSQIVLVGHSVGGWVALMAAAADPKIHCAASLDGYNLGKVGALMQTDAQEKADLIRYLVQTTDSDSGPIRASAHDLAAQLMRNPAAFDLAQQARALQDKTVLLLSGFHDDVAKPAQHLQPLAEAFRAAGMDGLSVKVLENGDHVASADRIALTRTLLR